MKPGRLFDFPRSILVPVGLITLAWACSDPEAIHLAPDGGGVPASGGKIGSSGGAAPTGGSSVGSGGAPIGSGGMTNTGGAPSGGRSGTGGSATGGAASGGMGTGGAATGGSASGGKTGTGGVAPGSGGASSGGAAGTPATGGRVGTGGSAAGGMADVTGTGGASTGTGGASTGTGPCMGMCASPIAVAIGKQSGPLGTGATCHEVLGTLGGVVCGNFAAPRTFSVNGTSLDCVKGGTYTPPAAKNGGYCMEASAGDFSYAYFATF